jgi:hypothetical protein
MNINEKVKVADEMMYGYKTLDEEMSSLFPPQYHEKRKEFNNFSFGKNSDFKEDKTILRKRRFR